MFPRGLLGRIRVARGDRLDAAVMLGEDLPGAAGICQCSGGEPTHGVRQFLGHRSQARIAGQVIYKRMERNVCGNCPAPVALGQPVSHVRHRVSKLLQASHVGPLRGKTCGEAIVHFMDLADLSGFLHINGTHHRATIRVMRDEPVINEPAQGLPDRRPADAESLSQLRLDEPSANWQLAGEDHLPHGVVDQAASRYAAATM